LKVATTSRERADEAREAQLEHIRNQVSSGELVIREMTKAERAKWAKRRAAIEVDSTPAERVRRHTVLKNRRRRAERNL